MGIVSALHTALMDRVGRERYDLWFGDGTKLLVEPDRVVVAAPNLFFQEWLRRNFRSQIEAAATQVLGHVPALEFEVYSESHPPRSACHDASSDACHSPAASAPPSHAPVSGIDREGPRRRFARLDTFVVGDSNRLAFTTAQLVAGQLARWSPLVVHGPSGVGKTHLLEGLWSAVRQSHRDASAVFLTAEQFTCHFLEALRGSGLPSFRRKYRGVDLLIVDGLQFFAGKRATLVELLYTVNTLVEEGRQIVFAADRSPAQMTELGSELVHRLNGGMVCRIDPPDYDVRLGVVRRLATDLQWKLPDEVIAFVAANVGPTARELSGAVNRLHAAHVALGRPITLETAQQELAELIRHGGRVVRLRDIEAAVCQVFGLETQTLQSDRRAREISYPRMLAMYLARKHTPAAYSEIGHFFGRRTHSTVVSAQKKVGSWIEKRELLCLGGHRCTAEEAIRRVERALEAV